LHQASWPHPSSKGPAQLRASFWPSRLVRFLLDTSYRFTRDNIVLHPEFRIVEGKYQMTKEWSVVLPGRFNRRFEDDNLVLWRPGFTIWIAVWGNDHNQSPTWRLSRIKADISKEAFDVEEAHGTTALRFSYRLKESGEDKRRPAYYGFAVGQNGHVQMAIYFDDEASLDAAKHILQSLNEEKVL
jgi:hypothetical protein